jgi:DNA-binding transcriptional ArsR family regulator
MTNSRLESAVVIARAVGHPARLRVLAMLRTGELCVCQITAVLELAASTVSAHLRELKLAGLVTERKAGRWVYVSLAGSGSAAAWLATALAGTEDDEQIENDRCTVHRVRALPVEDLCRLGYEAASRKHGGCGSVSECGDRD